MSRQISIVMILLLAAGCNSPVGQSGLGLSVTSEFENGATEFSLSLDGMAVADCVAIAQATAVAQSNGSSVAAEVTSEANASLFGHVSMALTGEQHGRYGAVHTVSFQGVATLLGDALLSQDGTVLVAAGAQTDLEGSVSAAVQAISGNLMSVTVTGANIRCVHTLANAVALFTGCMQAQGETSTSGGNSASAGFTSSAITDPFAGCTEGDAASINGSGGVESSAFAAAAVRINQTVNLLLDVSVCREHGRIVVTTSVADSESTCETEVMATSQTDTPT